MWRCKKVMTLHVRWSDVAITACACWVYSLTRRFWRVPTINVMSRHKKKICSLCRGGCGGRNWLKLFHIHICAQACCRNDGDARFVSFTLSTSNTGFLKHAWARITLPVIKHKVQKAYPSICQVSSKINITSNWIIWWAFFSSSN